MAPLDFQNVVGLNGLNYDSEASRFAEVGMLKRIYPPFYRCFILFWSAVVFSSVTTVAGAFMA